MELIPGKLYKTKRKNSLLVGKEEVYENLKHYRSDTIFLFISSSERIRGSWKSYRVTFLDPNGILAWDRIPAGYFPSWVKLYWEEIKKGNI